MKIKKFLHSGTITQDNTRVVQPVYIPTLEDLQLDLYPHYVTRVLPVITASKPKAQIEGERRIGIRSTTNKKEEFERNKLLMADALTFGMTPHRNDIAAQIGASDMANQVMYTLLGEGAIKAAPYITYGILGRTNLGKALYLNNGLRNPVINTTVVQNPLHNLSIYPNEEAVNWIYVNHPELASIGTKEQYLEYLRSIFPESQSKQVVWHGSNADFTKGFNSAKRVTGSSSPEAASRQDMFFNGRPADSYLYVKGINAPDNKLWGKHFYWYAKEILGKPNYLLLQWRNLPWEQTIREEIPNKKGLFTRKFNEATSKFEGYGKFLEEYKKELGAENLTDSEFFTQVLGFKPGESFNQWVARNKEIFEQVQSLYEGKGMYPALVDTRHPYVESPLLDTEYRDRGTFVKMKQNGNDVLYGPFSDNEFGSNVTLVVDGGGSNKNNIHWLGTPEDINGFKLYISKNPDILSQPLLVSTIKGDAAIERLNNLFSSGFNNNVDIQNAFDLWIKENPDAVFTPNPSEFAFKSNGKTYRFHSYGNLLLSNFNKLFIDYLSKTRPKLLGLNPRSIVADWFDSSTNGIKRGRLPEKIEFIKNNNNTLLVVPRDSYSSDYYAKHLLSKNGKDLMLVQALPREYGTDLDLAMLHEGYSHPTDRNILQLINPLDPKHRTFLLLYNSVSNPSDIIGNDIILSAYVTPKALLPEEARATNHEILSMIIDNISKSNNITKEAVLSRPSMISRYIDSHIKDILTNELWKSNAYILSYQRLYNHPALNARQRLAYKERFADMLKNYLSLASGVATVGISDYQVPLQNQTYYEQYKPGGKIKKRI